MSYHGLGASANFGVSVDSGGAQFSANADAGGGGGGGGCTQPRNPDGSLVNPWGHCDACSKTLSGCCGGSGYSQQNPQHGGSTGKTSIHPTTGAGWIECADGIRAGRKGFGQGVVFFYPGATPPPPPPPPSSGLTGIAYAIAAIQYQAQLNEWMAKLGKPAPATIKVIGGSGGNRPPAAGAPAPSTGKGKAGSVVNTGMGSKPGSVPGSTGSGSGTSSSGSSTSGGTSTGAFKGFSIFGGAGAAKQASGVQSPSPAPSTPTVGQGPIVSTYEIAPVPTMPVEKIIDPPDAGWSTGQMIAVGVAALAVIGGAVYFMSQRSENVLPRPWFQHRSLRQRQR